MDTKYYIIQGAVYRDRGTVVVLPQIKTFRIYYICLLGNICLGSDRFGIMTDKIMSSSLSSQPKLNDSLSRRFDYNIRLATKTELLHLSIVIYCMLYYIRNKLLFTSIIIRIGHSKTMLRTCAIINNNIIINRIIHYEKRARD